MPWYRTGTVAITAGQTTVTGSGTAFALNARVGDAFQGPDGRWYEVTNIASATVLSILPAYQGATVSGGAYGLAPMQGYVKESADRLRQLVDQWGATLAGLGTVSVENIVPLAKGGTGAATAAGARTNLGLGTAAAATLTTSTLDTTAGRALKVGDFGLGSLSGVTVAQALLNDNSLAGGIYRCDIAAGGYQGLLQAPHGVWQSRLNNSGATTQIAIHYNAHRLFFRGINTGDFQEALRRSDVVGAVSSAANAGAVIERGSNANGEYVRYADGTQICWGVAADPLVCTSTSGTGYQSPSTSNFTYPISFISAPRCSPGGYFPAGGLSRAWPSMAVVGAGSCTMVVHGFSNVASFQCAYIATGRWF